MIDYEQLKINIEKKIAFWQQKLTEVKVMLGEEEHCEVSGVKLSKTCQHEPEMDFGKDSRPRYIKGNNPICRKCGKIYELKDECVHKGDDKVLTEDGIGKLCVKCGRGYR